MSVTRPKLIDEVHKDHRGIRKVLVSFPDDWDLVGRLKFPRPFGEGERLVYVCADQPEAVKRDSLGLTLGPSRELDKDLTTYTLYKFFEAWPQPILNVRLYPQARKGGSVGEVMGLHDMDLALPEAGNAQVWHGPQVGILWEVILNRDWEGRWTEVLPRFWQSVEATIPSRTLYTRGSDPAYDAEVYPKFLESQGYKPSNYRGWWSKVRGDQGNGSNP